MDLVYDTQHTYRKLLDSMARPGKITRLRETEKQWIPCHPATYLIASTLLDAEVGFYVVSDDGGIGKLLAAVTSARQVPASEADYIIVPNGADQVEVLQVMETCKVGDLLDPHASATWLMEQDKISNSEGILLTGPGVKGQASLSVEVSEAFWRLREAENKEYPLGIDLIFMDPYAQLACIPRTTNVQRKGVEG